VHVYMCVCTCIHTYIHMCAQLLYTYAGASALADMLRVNTSLVSLSLNGTLQCVAVCCSVLQCVAVICSVLQCFAVCVI